MDASTHPLHPPPLLRLSNRLRRCYFLPTPYGLLLLMICIAILVGALNYENNLGLILAFLLLGMLLASWLQARRLLAGLTVRAGAKSPLFANRAGSLEVVLLGRDQLPFNVQLRVPGNEPVTVTVLPRRPIRVRLPVKPARRGWLHLHDLEAATSFPFGLWRLRRRKPLPGRLLVYPQPLVTPFAGISTVTGIEGDRVTGSGADDFSGLRPYMPGDPMQRIAWKASSRGQGLFTKDFGRLAGGMLHFDWPAAGPGDAETRLSRLCHLVLTARARQLAYSLALPGRTVPAGSGEAHSYRCLRELALYRAKA